MSNVRIILDGKMIAELLRGPAGPVYRHLERKGEIFQAAAKRDAPVRTGCLQSRIRKRHIEEVGGKLSLRVISDTQGCAVSASGSVTNQRSQTASAVGNEYAYFVHEGTGPHDIPNAFGYGPGFGIGGRFDGKFHPGTPAHKYLSKNLSIFVSP